MTVGHRIEDIWQGDKNQAWSLVRLHPVGEAGRENNQAGNDGDEGIQRGDGDGLAQQRCLFIDIASEDRHGADAHTEGEERLVHGLCHHVEKSDFPNRIHIWYQIKLQSFRAIFQEDTVDGQNDHDDEQGNHHEFGDFFDPILKSEGTDGESQYDDDKRKKYHGRRTLGQVLKGSNHSFGGCVVELSGQHSVEIIQHPAGDGGVEEHQHIICHESQFAVEMPFAAGLLKDVKGADRRGAAGPSDGQLHGHDRNPENHKKKEIQKNKDRSPVVSHNVWETPYISYADGASRRNQDKAKATFEFFSFHV